MSMENRDIAIILLQIADTLEINGENPYRVRAYRRAARRIEIFSNNIAELVINQYDLTSIPNIGKGIAFQIQSIVTTGKAAEFAKKKRPKSFRSELAGVSGLGKKRIAILQSQLDIYNRNDLLLAIKGGKLNKLKGFNKKFENKLLANLANVKPYEKYFKFRVANLIITSLKNHLETLEQVDTVICTGSYRRRAEVVGNVSFVAIGDNPALMIKQFIEFDEVKELIDVKETKATVILQAGMQVQLEVIVKELYNSLILYRTGSESHVQALVDIAEKQGLKLTEEGLFRGKRRVKCTNEEQIYTELGLTFIEPELRENRGEILASLEKRLPTLITLNDIKGDLHCHTNETDGVEPLEVMVKAAAEKGYQYIAITDHSKRLAITNGLDEKRLLKQIELIDRLNSEIKNITILKSIEVDILEDGTLDLSNDVLKELDLTVCSIHSKFKLSEDKQTERIIRAMDNPYFNILGHPTGRLIRYREPYAINIERILYAAKDKGCFVELNTQPSRLDLNDIYCLMAKTIGVKIAISSDAHSIRELDFINFGIYQARRGWIEANDVINTRSLQELKILLKRK